MQWATRWVKAATMALGVGLGACTCAYARPPEGAGAWEEAQSLRELPAGIQALLGVGLGGRDGIADRGESFNIGDIIVDNTPQRRFALGIGNGTTTVVAVEQGGIGYSVQVLEFHQDGTLWEPARCTARAGLPSHGMELLGAFITQSAGLVASCHMIDGHVSAETAPAPGMTASGPAALAPVAPGSPPRVRPRPGA